MTGNRALAPSMIGRRDQLRDEGVDLAVREPEVSELRAEALEDAMHRRLKRRDQVVWLWGGHRTYGTV